MKASRSTKTLFITLAVLLIGVTIAFAHGGWGYGGNGPMRGNGGRMMGPAYGGPMGNNACDGPSGRDCGRRGSGGSLSDEQLAQLDEARDKFRKETQAVRGQIDEKSVALRNEMVKEDPDTGKAMKLQKEISALKADLDQQRMQHRLEVKKIAPDAIQGNGDGRRSGRGGGWGGGRQFGRGGGYGYCR